LQVRNRAAIVGTAIVAVLVLILNVRVAAGHAVLVEASPAAKSTVAGPDVPISLRYNVRIEAGRSRLSLVGPDNAVTALTIAAQPSPDTLTTSAKDLKPGAYRLRWQVLASDGHITRGEVAFSVAAH
jgi:methionine-rich copper-binding protein CopC